MELDKIRVKGRYIAFYDKRGVMQLLVESRYYDDLIEAVKVSRELTDNDYREIVLAPPSPHDEDNRQI